MASKIRKPVWPVSGDQPSIFLAKHMEVTFCPSSPS